MLRVYIHYKYLIYFSARIDFRRQNLMSKVDLRAVGKNEIVQSLLYISFI